MKQYTPLGNWLYRVRLKDGTFGIVDAAATYHKCEEFRIPEEEMKRLREEVAAMNDEKSSLMYLATGYREPRKRISAKSAQRIAEIDAHFERLTPLSEVWKAYQDRQYKLRVLHKEAHKWYKVAKEMKASRALLREHGFNQYDRIDFKGSIHDDAVPGYIFIQRRSYFPCLSVRTPGVDSGLFGHCIHERNFAESIFHPGTAPAREPTPEEILAPLIGHVVSAPFGGRLLLVSVPGYHAHVRLPLKTKGKFAVREDSYYIHHPEEWKLAA